MTAPDIAAAYGAEVRRYLLGRLEQKHGDGSIEATVTTLKTHRLLSWWIFEGKRYGGIEGPLWREWAMLHRKARALLASLNPRWQIVDQPEGDVDWLASAVLTQSAGELRFRARASAAGLTDEERRSLAGWLDWIHDRWSNYVTMMRLPAVDGNAELPWRRGSTEASPRELQRWAYVARRSRWPLLRNVVAESLRCTFEAQELDRLPLPTKHSTLFELVCLVRILRELEPAPEHIRWLDHAGTSNEVVVGQVRCRFQRSLEANDVLATELFPRELRAAIERHGVRVPREPDGVIEFVESRGGFDGILLEAKSGQQSFDAAVWQLRAYRATLERRWPGARFLIWGIVEQEQVNEHEAIARLGVELSQVDERDVWVFSSAGRIADVLRATGILDVATWAAVPSSAHRCGSLVLGGSE